MVHRKLCSIRSDADIGHGCKIAAPANCRTVDSGNAWLRQSLHRQRNLLNSAEALFLVVRLGRFRFNVRARTESSTGSGDDENVYFFICLDNVKCGGQLVKHLQAESIEHLGAVQGKDCNTVLLLIQKVLKSL